jgi:hypothetical protein
VEKEEKEKLVLHRSLAPHSTVGSSPSPELLLFLFYLSLQTRNSFRKRTPTAKKQEKAVAKKQTKKRKKRNKTANKQTNKQKRRNAQRETG